uniref:Uncharacterized protein n=1 Tax=Triatoma infestans TaxID=30076 RepID=A0A161M0N5_TRIIF
MRDTARRTYEDIKTIIKHCSISDEEKLRKLFSHIELGDKKPTQLLKDIKTLAGPSIRRNHKSLMVSKVTIHHVGNLTSQQREY